jgi:hypothetical protein
LSCLLTIKDRRKNKLACCELRLPDALHPSLPASQQFLDPICQAPGVERTHGACSAKAK